MSAVGKRPRKKRNKEIAFQNKFKRKKKKPKKKKVSKKEKKPRLDPVTGQPVKELKWGDEGRLKMLIAL